MSIKKFILFISLGVIFLSCDLEKEIEIVDLPVLDPELVVECYMEIGQPLRLLLTETIPFDSIPENQDDLSSIPFVDGAIVIITINGIPDTLSNGTFIDVENFKIYNYGASRIVPEGFNNLYSLIVIDSLGRVATSSTRILEPVPIDSVVVEYSEFDTTAAVLTWFTDPADEVNFYRRVLNFGTLSSEEEQAFTVDDPVFNGDAVVFGTGFDYAPGDTVITTIFHIDEAYHDFLETVDAAQNANLNPFAPPSFILDNIEGGTGVFTGISYDRDTVIIE